VHVVVIGVVAEAPPRPAVLHIHGGGYIAGTVAEGIGPLQQLSAAHGCVVVSVDYRLAPETRFPGSREDNYAALRWLYANAKQLGVDRNRIALLGESAGGGHVAALAIAARDRGEVPVAMQVMIYPMLDDRTGSSRTVAPHLGAFVWDAAANRFGWSSLLGVPAGSAAVPRGAVPARVENLHGLPPTFIAVGSIDLFVEEDIAYAQRLIQAGVPTELFIAPGGYHGFDIIVPEARISKRFKAAWNDALHRGLNTNEVP
jgi:acetyl esterase/lipase